MEKIDDNKKKRSIHFIDGFEYLQDKLVLLSKERGDSVNLLIMKAIKSMYGDK
jgi:hypothetical protein